MSANESDITCGLIIWKLSDNAGRGREEPATPESADASGDFPFKGTAFGKSN